MYEFLFLRTFLGGGRRERAQLLSKEFQSLGPKIAKGEPKYVRG